MQTLEQKNSRSVILELHPKSLFFVIKNRHLKLSFDAVHWNTNTLFYHVHDGDFGIRPNEPKLIIGEHFF